MIVCLRRSASHQYILDELKLDWRGTCTVEGGRKRDREGKRDRKGRVKEGG
jgi:hypothetical protein